MLCGVEIHNTVFLGNGEINLPPEGVRAGVGQAPLAEHSVRNFELTPNCFLMID